MKPERTGIVTQGDPINLVSKRADGSQHRVWRGAWPTPDAWAWYLPPHAPVEEASGKVWSSPYPVIALFWPQTFYQVFLLLKENTTEYYCNMIAPVEYKSDEGVISFIDLDLDVMVTGTNVTLLDADEFEQRKALYPAAWQKQAESASRLLVRLGEEKKGVFKPAIADGWRAWVSKTINGFD